MYPVSSQPQMQHCVGNLIPIQLVSTLELDQLRQEQHALDEKIQRLQKQLQQLKQDQTQANQLQQKDLQQLKQEEEEQRRKVRHEQILRNLMLLQKFGEPQQQLLQLLNKTDQNLLKQYKLQQNLRQHPQLQLVQQQLLQQLQEQRKHLEQQVKETQWEIEQLQQQQQSKPYQVDHSAWSFMVIGGLNVNSLLMGEPKQADDQAQLVRDKKREVEQLIAEHDLDILVIGESKLSEKTTPMDQCPDPVYIDDFTYVRQDRYFKTIASGGLIVYIRDGIEYKTKSHWEWSESNVQFIEISITEPTRFDLVAVYCPNKEHAKSVTDLMKFFLERNKKLNTPVMFVGDLNIDPNRTADKRAKQALDQLIAQFSIKILIKGPTHEQGSCIDHIITNIPEELMIPVTPNVIKTIGRIADHNLVLCRVKNEILSISQPTVPPYTPVLPKHCYSGIMDSWGSTLIKEGKTKVLITMFYEFNEPIRTVDVQLPSGAKDDRYPYVRMQNLKIESVEPVKEPEIFRQRKWLHSKVSEDGKEVSVCAEFDSTDSVFERGRAADDFIKNLKEDNYNPTINSAEYTVAVLYRKPLPLGKNVHEVDENCCFLLKCTMEQLTSGDKSLHNLLKKYSCLNS